MALAQTVPLRVFTDSKHVFNIIIRGEMPTKRRLAIDVTAIVDAYEHSEIDRVGLFRGSEKLADSLTNLNANKAP